MKQRTTEPRPREEPTEAVYGLRAALAVFEVRRDDITRVVHAEEARAECTALLRWAAAQKVPAQAVDGRELGRVAGTEHHEGLCVVARPRRWTPPNALADKLLRERGVAVAMDRVRNPYNIGAVLRTAAFFGVDAAVLGAQAPHPALAPMAVRVAEGGAEHLTLCRTTDLADTLARLRARGVLVVGAEATGAVPLGRFSFARPTVLVLGHEREGLSERVRALCDARVAIVGTGAVESLNVGVAAGVMIAALVAAPSAGELR
jgi:TrmH RNA methyltransferase